MSMLYRLYVGYFIIYVDCYNIHVVCQMRRVGFYIFFACCTGAMSTVTGAALMRAFTPCMHAA